MRRDEGGFTVVEVLAASALLSALGLCLLRGWTVLDRLSFELLLRQKAVFVLNGEMERLALLYDTTAFGSSLPGASSTGYTAYAGIVGSGSRNTYTTTVAPVTFATASYATFSATNTPDSTVWEYGPQGSVQNFVWLDRSRGLLARVSWSACTVTSSTSKICWATGASPAGPAAPAGSTATCYGYSGGNGVCQLVTLFLDYPYIANGGTPGALATLTPVTLSLSTIVGRRK